MYLLGILCLVAATVALPVLPDPPTLPDSIAAALQDSEIYTNIQNAVIDSAPAKIKEDNDEIQKSKVKIDSVVIPPPPQLSPFDYSILKKQIANQKQKYEDFLKQQAENSKKEKEAIFLEKAIKDEVLPNPPTWPSSEAALRNSEIITNINAASDSASAANTKDHEEVKNSRVKVASAVIPPPPELPPFDYSILRKQIADQKRKSEYSAKQGADNIGKPAQVEVVPNPVIVPGFVTAMQDTEDRENIFNAVSNDASVAAKKDDEEEKNNINKIVSVLIPPPPPELPPFDYSILRKQIADQKPKSEYSAKQGADSIGKPVQVEVAPNPVIVPGSVTAIQDTEDRENIFNVVSNDASVAAKKDDEEAKNNINKIVSVLIPPPPPELPPFDYSILRKQIADQKPKSEYSAKQGAYSIGKPVQVEVAPNPVIVPGSVTAIQDTEDRENIFNVVSNDASVAAKKDDEEAKDNINKIVSVLIPPPPPELPPFDYSILRKQIADQKPKSEYSAKQGAYSIGKPVQVEVAPNPVIVPGFVTAMQDTEDRENIFNVVSNDASVAAKKDDEEEKNNINKIVSVLIPPPPPELPPFDYSILRKQIADQKPKSEYSAKQGADSIGKLVQVEVAPNPVIVPGSVTAIQDTEDRENIFNVVSNDASVAAKKDDEEEKNNINKIVSVLIPPPPPELPPFDYSILRKQIADQKQKSEYYAKQKSDKSKSKKEKEGVNQNLEKPVQIEVAPNPATLSGSVSALEDSGNRENILNVVSDGTSVAVKEAKNNMVKIASIVIPPPPELPPFDYSTLKRQEVEQKQNYENSAKQETKKKGVVIVEKPVEVQVEEEPKITAETKIIEDSKPKEELKKEPVKPSENLPVIIQWTIPSAPFLSKLISNCPQLPSIGLEWPFQRSSIARRPRIIYPKFDTDGIIHTN